MSYNFQACLACIKFVIIVVALGYLDGFVKIFLKKMQTAKQSCCKYFPHNGNYKYLNGSTNTKKQHKNKASLRASVINFVIQSRLLLRIIGIVRLYPFSVEPI